MYSCLCVYVCECGCICCMCVLCMFISVWVCARVHARASACVYNVSCGCSVCVVCGVCAQAYLLPWLLLCLYVHVYNGVCA